MDSTDAPNATDWAPPQAGNARSTRLAMARLFVQLSGLTGLWLAAASLINAHRFGLDAAAHVLLSAAFAAVVGSAALACLILASMRLRRARWGLALAGFVVLGYALCWWLGGDMRVGRPSSAMVIAGLLVSSGAALAWLAAESGGPHVFHMTRLSAATALAGTLVAVLGAQGLSEMHRGQAVQQAQVISHQVGYQVFRGMQDSTAWLRRLAERWALLPEPPSLALMQQEMRSYLRDQPTLENMVVMDADGNLLSMSVPARPQQAESMADRLQSTPVLVEARQSAQLVRGAPQADGQGQIVVDVLVPVLAEDFDNLIIAAQIAVHQLLDSAALRAPAGFDFRVLNEGRTVYQSRATWPTYADVHDVQPLPLDQAPGWQLEYLYRPAPAGPLAPGFPELILLTGFGFTFFLVVTQQLARLARQRSHQLQHSALHDTLTGLPNRRLLEQTLADACNRARTSQGRLAIVFVDLDGVKLVNDSMGHLVGDKLLVEVARRIAHAVGDRGFLARIGGDEFVVLLRDHTDAFVEGLTQRIIQDLARPYGITATELRVTATAGISFSDGDVKDPMQLVREADLAMVRAKQEGRNTWRRYTVDLSVRVAERLAVRNELQNALDERKFELHYQPVIDGQSGRITGLEALLRWQDAVNGYIPPARFLPLAEETGQIVPLSEWVLEQACQDARSLRLAGIVDVPVIVNVSPLYFQRNEFVPAVRAALEASELPEGSLELEITEGVLLEDAERAARTLMQLRHLGVKTSIDDFGTGYSSLNYLKNLPIDKIKIDRSFVVDVVSDPNDAAIVQGIIAMAHHLELQVVAEGIETAAQFSFLKRHHCDQYQGFLFWHPSPFEMMFKQLRERGNRLVLPDAARERDHQRTLLLLDDEANILRALVRLLRRDGYRILIANSPTEAFDVLARQPVQVIVSDQRMPELNGIEFLSQVKEMYPQTIRMVLSGYTDLKSVTDAINRGAIYKFLTKPWDDEALRNDIAQAFQHHETRNA